MSYEHLIEVRKIDINGETDWHWIKSDNGAWQGPKENWIAEHSSKFFKHLDNRRVIVTAGANCGMYTRFYAKLFERVYAFEPDPLNFHCMVLNTQFDNVIKMNAALGSECKLIDLRRPTMTNTGMHAVDESKQLIPMITIDTLKLDCCDFIQLDVEGYELHVILGAIETINKFSPVIAAENGHKCEHILFNMGYKKVDQSVSDAIYKKGA